RHTGELRRAKNPSDRQWRGPEQGGLRVCDACCALYVYNDTCGEGLGSSTRLPKAQYGPTAARGEKDCVSTDAAARSEPNRLFHVSQRPLPHTRRGGSGSRTTRSGGRRRGTAKDCSRS